MGPLDHWGKPQSELAYIFIKNVKGFRWPPPAGEGGSLQFHQTKV